MTADVADLLRRVHRAGGRLEPRSGTLRVRAPEPLPADLVDELRARKPEVLALLTEGQPVRWHKASERARLEATYNRCDEDATRTPSWHDAWTWCRETRPDLVEAVDDALDAIDAAFQTEYVADNIRACRHLERAIRAGAEAYLEAHRTAGARLIQSGKAHESGARGKTP